MIYSYIGHITAMLILLAGSAFFSGSETAFFNLTRSQLKQFRKSGQSVQRITSDLMSRPGRLLGVFLLGNMIVNILYYASGSVLTIRVESEHGVTAAAGVAFLSFMMLVLIGEVFPKSFAYSNSRVFALGTAVGVYMIDKLLGPIQGVFRFLIVDPVLKLILGPSDKPKPFSVNEFKILIDATRKQELISADEDKLLNEAVELSFLKVRQVMRPRVDMPACDIDDPVKTAVQIMRDNCRTKLPVYEKNIDHIIGIVYLRDILLRPETGLRELVSEVTFVPEQKKIESLLSFFRESHTDFAIVVDEYGGIAGTIRLEDIAEEFLGPIELQYKEEPIEQIGPFKFRMSGNLSVHDWAQSFGMDHEDTQVSTMGGLVTALLGKIPKEGDQTHLRNLKFTVESVKKNRIQSVILEFEPISK